MTKTFKLTEDNHCEIITAERERFIIYDDNVKQLIFLTPTAVTGEITETHEDISCLTFKLDERLNLNIWRELCSSIYCEDKQLTEGEYWDIFQAVHEENIKLKEKIRELENVNETLYRNMEHLPMLKVEDNKLERLRDDIKTALNWYRYLPQHVVRHGDVKAFHRLENYLKENNKK